jgi:hypothetical protein
MIFKLLRPDFMLKDFFTFASNNPFLTFFLFIVIGNTIIYSLKWIAYTLRGGIPPKTDDDE